MRLRLRPLFVALCFLSFVVVGGVATAWLPVLLGGRGSSPALIGAALLAGAAFASAALTAVTRPALLWGGALAGCFVLALPVSVASSLPPLVGLALAAALGASGASVLLGACRAVQGGVDAPGQDLGQLAAVAALGLAVGLGLPFVGLIAAAGFDGVARVAGLLAFATAVLVVASLRAERLEAVDQPLRASPVRLFALGAALGGMLVLAQTVFVRAMGESIVARPLVWVALLVLVAAALARVAARADVDADLGWRRATQAAGLAFGVLALLVPRLPAAFVFTEAVVRSSTAGWLVAQVLRLGLVLLVSAPVGFVAGTALGCSARDAVRTPSDTGRWGAALTLGAALGWALTSAALTAGSFEGLWALVAIVAIAAASWERVDVLPAVGVGLLLLVGHGWQAELSRAGPATHWRRVMPSGPLANELVAADARDDVTLQREKDKALVRVGGHVELVTGRAAERALLGVHHAVLTGAGQFRSALVLGVAPGLVEALAVHGVKQIDVVAPAGLLAAAKEAGVDLSAATTHASALRPFLERAEGQWDLIVIVPARPGTALSRGLFTLEAWQAARALLTPGGQLVQRVDLLESNNALVQTAVRTLRLVFPVGSTVGGVGEVSLVVSGVPQVLEPERLAARMQAPAVTAALRGLELASPPSLLAWQVHSTEGQVRFAGPGAAATDRRPLLDLGVPLAAFTDEVVELGDERGLLGPSSLPLSRLAREGRLGKKEYEKIHRALARHYAAWEPLVRSSAEAWATADGSSVEALAAVARSALAQNDVTTAVELLAPRLRDEAPAPELVALALEAMTAQLSRESAVFRPLDPAPLKELGRRTLARHPGHQALATALRTLEAAP